MNRNTESHFALTPTVDIGRSKFDRSFDHKTTFNCGDLIPIYYSDVLPGDTVKMRTSEVVRMMTPIAPVMDNCYLDTYFFFVPDRLVWDNFKRFMGENETAPWTQTVEYEIPQIIAPDNGWKKGSLADYFGYPTEVGGYKASAMPFRQYCKIWNDWFRDENLKDPVYLTTGDADIQGTDKTTLGASYNYVIDTEKGAAPCKAAKFHDYFTSCLPNSQKGTQIQIPLGDTAPLIVTEGDTWDGTHTKYNGTGVGEVAKFATTSGSVMTTWGGDPAPNDWEIGASKTFGLVADLSAALGATVTQLRQSFQIQKYLEKDALYGKACA